MDYFGGITSLTTENLEELYKTYNCRKYVHPDPLEFLYMYDDTLDREIVALIASSLAYGRVSQILRSVEKVLEIMGSPRDFVENSSQAQIRNLLSDFKHRFSTGDEMAALLIGAGNAVRKHGSLLNCFLAGLKPEHTHSYQALCYFTHELSLPNTTMCCSLLPNPGRKSACKRLHLMLKWLIRKDEVDPGGWHEHIPASILVIPLDTHMHRIAKHFGLTVRKSADMITALEITKAFALFAPDDPAKYDFALTRPGIWNNNPSQSPALEE